MATKYINSITYGGNEYKIIDDTSGYTKNTGTVTSVGLANATNGGLTVSGSPVTGSGSITVGHTNVLTNAQTTQAVYPIAIDKNGHISSYGTAVDIPTPELFVVNATITQVSDGIPTGGTTDKSAQEIYNAAAAGLLPVIKVAMSSVGTVYLVAPLALTENPGDSYYARFVYEDQDNSTFKYATLHVVGTNFTLTFKDGYVENDSCAITVSSPLYLDSSQSSSNDTGYIANNNTIALSLEALGNIQPEGTLQPSDVTVATGDRLVITDYSDSDKVARASIGFDTTDTSKYLRHDGTWQTVQSSGGTVTSVGLSNATDGGLSISGSPITSSGSITVGHSNVLSNAQSTQAVYPITIDKNGHIASYGTAVTPLEPFKITLTVQSGPTYVPDKTYAEIAAAEAAGKFVYVYFHDTDAQTDMTYILPLVSMNNDSDEIYFECFGNGCYYVCTINGQNGADFETLSMGSSGGGTVTSVSISGTSPISASGTVTDSGTLSVSHADSGVTAGDYTKVTVDSKGHATNGVFEYNLYPSSSIGQLTYQDIEGDVGNSVPPLISYNGQIYSYDWDDTAEGEMHFSHFGYDMNYRPTLYSFYVYDGVSGVQAYSSDRLAKYSEISDTKVTQTVRTNDASYPLLLAPSGQSATTTTTANFATAATYNPSTGTLSVKQKVLAGTTADTTENWIQVASKSGQIYLDSVGNSGGTGTRGIWVGAHGTATSGKWALEVDTNNVVKLNGDITGNAATATTATSATNADNAAAITPQLNNPTSSSTRYIPFLTGTSSSRIPYVNNGLEYLTLEGTASANGYGCLILGNSTASGTAGNKYGAIRIYASNAYYTELRSAAVTASRTLNLPLITATGYLLGKSSTSAIGASNQLVYFSASGVASAGIKISGGTAEPSGGSSGDIYIQYSA